MENLIGNQGVQDRIRRVIASERCPHAFVFAGPKGVGKYSFATTLGLELLGANSCEHPDFHTIKKEDVVWSSNPSLQRKKQTNIPVDLIRERMIGGTTSDGSKHDAAVFKTPVSGFKKVFIIDEAELLDESGQNALLKTLEEPPTDTVVFLITSREDLLLQTVLSRCHLYAFGPLSTQEMGRWLNETSRDSEVGGWLCGWSSGSPGVFIEGEVSGVNELFSQVGSFLQNPRSMDSTSVVEMMNEFLNRRQELLVSENPNISKEAVNRRGVELLLKVFGWHASCNIRNGLDSGDMNRGVQCAEMISNIEQQTRANISVKVLIESLVVQWKQLFAETHLSV